MRIGILAEDKSEVFYWKKLSDNIHELNISVFYLTEVPSNTRRINVFSIPSRLIWKIICWYEGRRFDFQTEVFAPNEKSNTNINCHFKGHFKEFSKQEISKVADLNLDLIIRLGGRGIYRGEILNVSRLGIISIHHGDNRIYRGSAPGFYEALNGNERCGFIVQKLTEKLDAGEVLRRGEINSTPHAALNMKNLYLAADDAASGLISYIIERQQLPQSEPPDERLGPIYPMPTLSSLAKYLWIQIVEVSKPVTNPSKRQNG